MADSNYISFRCPESLRARLEQIAARDERSLSDVIRRGLTRYAAALEANPDTPVDLARERADVLASIAAEVRRDAG